MPKELKFIHKPEILEQGFPVEGYAFWPTVHVSIQGSDIVLFTILTWRRQRDDEVSPEHIQHLLSKVSGLLFTWTVELHPDIRQTHIYGVLPLLRPDPIAIPVLAAEGLTDA